MNNNNNIQYKMVNEDFSKSQPFANLKALKNTNINQMQMNETPSPLPLTTPTLQTNEQSKFVNTNDFLNNVKTYIETQNPKLYILTPCYGGMCYVNYLICLIKTLELFKSINFPIQVEFCRNDSLVTRARNNLLAKAMTDKKMTHVLFIDSDISWDPVDILKLILDNKALIGGVYPLKKYEWNKILKDPLNPYNTNVTQTIIEKKNNCYLKDFLTDEESIQCNLVNYNLNYLDNLLNIQQNIAKVRHIATGFMMLQRDVIVQMCREYSQTKYDDDVGFLTPEENKHAHALFDCGVEDGHYYSEDWLFCHRWTKMGNDVFVDVSVNLTHTGLADYKGCLMSSLI